MLKYLDFKKDEKMFDKSFIFITINNMNLKESKDVGLTGYIVLKDGIFK